MAAYQVPTDGSTTMIPTLVTDTIQGRLITGAEKLAQRFLIEFTTDTGSMPFNTERGSNFLQLVRSGSVYSELDITSAFYVAMLNVASRLQGEEGVNDSAEERFGAAELSSIVVNVGSITMSVRVYNRANQVVSVKFPVVFTPTSFSTQTID
jgi:hypothetical protein